MTNMSGSKFLSILSWLSSRDPWANMGRGMITRPIWKCPCIKRFIKLCITYFRHLEKRHPYWPENGHFHIGLVIIPRPILAQGSRDDNQDNMEMPMY
jgi:hypothetical protein